MTSRSDLVVKFEKILIWLECNVSEITTAMEKQRTLIIIDNLKMPCSLDYYSSVPFKNEIMLETWNIIYHYLERNSKFLKELKLSFNKQLHTLLLHIEPSEKSKEQLYNEK